MRLERYEYKHNEQLIEIAKVSEPWIEWHRALFDSSLANREGFVVINSQNVIVGCITFSDYWPDSDVVIHCSIHPDYHKRWLTKQIYKQVFDHVFGKLKLHRCSGYIIEGCTPQGFHERLGFKLEGIKRKGVKIQGTHRDIYLYGMLKEERRW